MSDLDSVVETPVAVPEATPEPVPPAEQETETPQEETEQAAKPEKSYSEEDFQKALQKRLGIESRRLQRVAEAEARAKFAESRLAELQAPKPEQPTGEPVPAQFQDYESYIKAKVAFDVDQKISGFRKESEAQQQQRQMEERAQAVMPKLKTAMAKYDDFNEVATSYEAPPAVQAAMLDSDHTGELYYYLGSNPDELGRISKLSEVKQVLAIKDLEAKLTAPPAPTKAPPPIVPNSTKASVTKDPAKMDYDEFVKWRRDTIKRR